MSKDSCTVAVPRPVPNSPVRPWTTLPAMSFTHWADLLIIVPHAIRHYSNSA